MSSTPRLDRHGASRHPVEVFFAGVLGGRIGTRGLSSRSGPLNGGAALAHDLFSVKDRVVIVTGSSRGIGRSIVEEMARAGAKVVISSRKIEACNEVWDALRAEGADATAVACNADRKDELRRLVDTTLKTYGRIDCVASNVGINPVYGLLKDLPDEVWDKVMSTNVRSAWQLANMSLPEISRAGGGSFIVASSISALRAAAGQGVYAVSKAAASHLAVDLANERGSRQYTASTQLHQA